MNKLLRSIDINGISSFLNVPYTYLGLYGTFVTTFKNPMQNTAYITMMYFPCFLKAVFNKTFFPDN